MSLQRIYQNYRFILYKDLFCVSGSTEPIQCVNELVTGGGASVIVVLLKPKMGGVEFMKEKLLRL